MATTTTLYRFQIELSDIPRAVYETLDFRVAQHPSEHMPYLLTRVLAYILNTQDGLAFSATGLHDPDTAPISIVDAFGGFKLVIEIGSPSARKLHKTTKVSKEVKVYNYKSPDRFMNELREEKIHRVDEIDFFSFTPEFLEELALVLKRDNRWSVLFDDGTVTVQVGEQSIAGELTSHRY
jgi:uncharacterized protein YaeQ